MNAVISAELADMAGGERTLKNFEIIVPAGKCSLEYGGKITELSDGDVAIIPPFAPHSVYGAARLIVLDMAMLAFKDVRVFKDGASRPIYSAAAQADKFRSDEILSALGSLIVAYVREFCKPDKLTPVVETVKSDILKNLSDPLYSLGDSLKKLPLNYDYVRKLFQKELGLTPREYLLSKRMELARELLTSGLGNRYSNYSVAQVAESCGFSDPLYFSRVYKKFYGQAPSFSRLQ